jgi:hypothetical protein
LQCFSRCVFRAIGKYCDRGDILMHRLYMCSNLKYPFELQRIERIMACTNVNSGLPSFYWILLLQQGWSMKGEHFCLVSSCGQLVIKNRRMMRSTLHQVQTFECPHGPHLSQLGEDMAVLQFGRWTWVEDYSNVRRGNDEDILGPCGVRFDPEAHIPHVEYG